ncbi:hypothetical protein [Polaromonas sp.]|uniref:hypothetical protein n=1 Tax=Polaromonas sp. TaxID=1869339 RepID=UPI002489BAB5|nr:hypothetical protein [Polaromonas sp.]MDI1275433.1 hypothetical protein [Polaromonas sp.]
MMIAIDGSSKLVYEGQGHYGYGLWPSPVLSLATPIREEADFDELPPDADLYSAKLLFREDSFDPVTRVRRGRFYVNPGTQPQSWKVTPHSFLPSQALSPMSLHGFDGRSALNMFGEGFEKALIALGSRQAFTLWRVISVERIVTGEDLFTLRARSALGVLPELDQSAIPEHARHKVNETVGKLIEAAYRAGPESVVDRARDVAQWCIGAWLSTNEGDPSLRLIDLWELSGRIPEKDFAVIRNTGRSLARLHARNKPNVQEEKSTRPVTEDDAEYSIAAVGLVLRELGWSN